MKKTQALWSVAIAFSIAPLGLYFYRFHSSLSEVHGKWGEFGSYLSGVYGSLAFMAVAYTTYVTQRQFRMQNEDSVFFKVIDSMHNRISLAKIQDDGSEYPAYQALKYISEKFRLVLMDECREMARNMLCTRPEAIDDVHYINLVISIYDSLEYLEDFKRRLIDKGSSEARWEYLKYCIGNQDYESSKVRETLEGIGSVYFYTVPFEFRRRLYEAALAHVMEAHGEFLDGYLSNLLFVSELATKGVHKDSYSQLLNAQLTRYEVIIIFYMLAGAPLPKGAQFVRELGLLRRLGTYDCTSLMIDAPSPEQIADEINSVFAKEGVGKGLSYGAYATEENTITA